MWRQLGLIGLTIGSLITGCARPQGEAPAREQEPARPSRTLVVAHRYEPANLATKVLGSNGPLTTTRLFNASLALFDDRGEPRPYLAEELPQLHTESWRVFPDGRMETTYRLRAGLTWQDGTPLMAEDFAFALQVYKHPDLGVFIRVPQGSIDSVQTPDPRTVVVHWRKPYPDAGILSFGDLDPLPRHLLEEPFTDLVDGRATREG
ncbi:MAG: hypothetical protein K6T92_03535, partial [Candidatus Rokubacteria bacterium]|nr:hypothetical protein [Candidatus Rokubacteria bacterium]